VATVPGTAVFLTSDPAYAPPSLLHNLKHNKVLHAQVVVLTVVNVDAPRLDDGERATVERLDARFVRVAVRFGFMEDPNLSRALQLCRRQGLKFDVMSTSFFLSRRKLVAEGRYGMPLWQDRLYISLAAIAADPSDFYRLPRDRIVELGSQMAV
jgi:KUP system potassium uptake protein